MGERPAFGAGPEGLATLADGSLVDPDRYDRRYARATGLPAGDDGDDRRTETERDRGRLQYSPYLRRLAGVTQVVSPDLMASNLHSRSSHTHKVAMLSREIAENLVRRANEPTDEGQRIARIIFKAGGLDIAACEAAGLAHDLGHPPFGHAGEEALDTRYRNAYNEGFEGNAQSFRIVTRLDVYKQGPPHAGLDLTYVTLAAILKYPWVRPQPYEAKTSRKFGAYNSEGPLLDEVRESVVGTTTSRQQTLEASVMDLADDMSYAIHDLEDFLTSGLIDARAVVEEMNAALAGRATTFKDSGSPDAFTTEANALVEKYEPYFDDDTFKKTIDEVKDVIDGTHVTNDSNSHRQIRTLLSAYVNQFFHGIVVSDEPAWTDGPLIYLNQDAWHVMHCLKVITRRFVVSTSRVGMLQRAQRMAILKLADSITDWLNEQPKKTELPTPLLRVMGASGYQYEETVFRPEDHRSVADYICGMSDSEALLRARWMSGVEAPGLDTGGAQY